MADAEQLQILQRGVEHWNIWRREHPKVAIDLTQANLAAANLSDANFSEANLSCANLSGAKLQRTALIRAMLSPSNLSGADLSWADLYGVNLICADLTNAILYNAFLLRANLLEADLSGASLKGARLDESVFVRTNFSNANLEGCEVFGVSAWGLTLEGANQKNLRITPVNEPSITVDDLEVAQFIYLLLNNKKVRNVINTITTKSVLILGRFTPERKAVLDAIRDELRQQDYLPIIFDFDQPATRDLTETVSTLAHMPRFIIADITEPKSVPQELYAIVPHLVVPVQPLLLASENEYSMFGDLRRRYHWVLPTHKYERNETLITELRGKVIAPAEAKVTELRAMT
jgi:hypothetical protein